MHAALTGVLGEEGTGYRKSEQTASKIASKNPQEVDERENPSLLKRPPALPLTSFATQQTVGWLTRRGDGSSFYHFQLLLTVPTRKVASN